MSGTAGTSGVPKPITGLLIDRPFVDEGGKLAPWAAQVLLRLQTYVGAPSSSSSSSSPNVNETLTESIESLSSSIASGLGGPVGDASLYSRVAALEAGIAPLPGFATPAPAGLPPLAPIWLSTGQEAASEGMGVPVLDPVTSNSGTAFLRSLIAGNGISVALTADGTGIVIGIATDTDLTSDGALVTSTGTQVTSGA